MFKHRKTIIIRLIPPIIGDNAKKMRPKLFKSLEIISPTFPVKSENKNFWIIRDESSKSVRNSNFELKKA